MMDLSMIQDIRSHLSQYNGAAARLWLYIQSLRQLHIQLTIPGTSTSTDLICYGCSSIVTKVNWTVRAMELLDGNEQGTYILQDLEENIVINCRFIRVVSERKEPVV